MTGRWWGGVGLALLVCSIPSVALLPGCSLVYPLEDYAGVNASDSGSAEQADADVIDAASQTGSDATIDGELCTGAPLALWASTAVPATRDNGSYPSIELGVKFRSDVDAYILGIRYFKSLANGGTHTGSLWTSGGKLLRSAVFRNETNEGWQEVTFSAPVPIAANTVYVASYHTDVGHQSADGSYFATAGVNTPPLHALSAKESPNGVYAYGETVLFPDQPYESYNYWVDVRFCAR